MTEPWKSLAHARWECKSHAVVVPTERGKAVDGESRASVGGLFPELARQQKGRSVAGHWLGAPVHMGRESPPTQAVASILGFLKGKRAGASARQFGRKLQNCTGAQFWARGSAGSTVGDEVEKVKPYIRAPEAEEQAGRL